MTKTALVKSSISKKYLSDPERFAQIYNNTLFGGNDVIRPEYLKELDTMEQNIQGIYLDEIENIWRDRDILKVYNGQMVLAIMGIENQTEVHYCMPLRCNVYDTLNYEEQRAEIAKRHKKEKDLSGAEFLSGFAKDDKLIPVFTLVIYFGTEEWDGPVSLHQMLDIPDALVPYKENLMDYRINLLDICRMENLEQYEGELKGLLGFVKYQKDKEALQLFVNDNKNVFGRMSSESVQAITVLANAGSMDKYLRFEKGEETETEVCDVCQALDEMMEDSRQIGMKMGRQKGRREGGIQTLIEDNLEEGISEERILEKLRRRFLLTEKEAGAYIDQYRIAQET